MNQSKILVLLVLLVLLAVSTALNVYLYFKPIKLSYAAVIGTWIDRNIQGGMGKVRVGIINRPFGGLVLPRGCKFNVSISVDFWAPYTGPDTCYFTFKLYERNVTQSILRYTYSRKK